MGAAHEALSVKQKKWSWFGTVPCGNGAILLTYGAARNVGKSSREKRHRDHRAFWKKPGN